MPRAVDRVPRRVFLNRMLGVGAAVPGHAMIRPEGQAVSEGRIKAFDHVAVPLQRVEPMMAFYRALGLTVRQTGQAVTVHFGDQKINFHLPALWQRPTFTLKAPAAAPPCGDFCFVWDGSQEDLRALLARVGATVEEGPVTRAGGRAGGADNGMSTYVRDPDGNLLEFIIYG